METILIVLDSKKLENPDLDIIYDLPTKLERYTNNEIYDNGYDYLTNTEIGIWLATKSAKEAYNKLIEFLENHMLCGNDLTATAKIYLSDKEAAPLEECSLVYDGEEKMSDEATRVTSKSQKVSKIILNIAKILVNENNSVIETLTTSLNKPEDTDAQWQCFVDVLKNQHYIIECDMDLEFDGFWEMLTNMESVKTNTLSVVKDSFHASEDMYDWCDTLDEQWEDDGFCMATFDLENGNEVIFPCSTERLEELAESAKELGIRIVSVAEA